ncbi:MAG: ABC transporter permease [Acidobacteria bacterium]|nr:ABC transporter permease [Acidobacteriota bacterium]
MIRYSLRRLWATPGFTLVAIVTLALGIGANTSAFSVADALLFRPVDLPDLDSLYSLFGTAPNTPDDTDQISAADLHDFRTATTIEHVSITTWWDVNITGTGNPERVQGFKVSGDFFEAGRVRAQLGRTLLPADDREGSRVVVLGHDLWLRRFGANPHMVGSTVELDGQAHQVVGIMPKGFKIPRSAELWVPMALTPDQSASRNRQIYDAIARLKPGVSRADADHEVKSIAARIAAESPNTHKGRGARLALFREYISGDYTAQYTMMIFLATAFVLLIACVNLATLLFARCSLRNREMAVRSALGATRTRLAGMLLTESATLGSLGAILGIFLAVWGIDMFRAGMPAEVERYLPGWWKLGVSLPMLVFAVVTAILSGVAAGLIPALQTSGAAMDGLREGGRAGTGSNRHRLINSLVVLEMVLALVLLVGAGLMAKGLRSLSQPYSNDVAQSTLSARLVLPTSRYSTNERRTAFQQRLLDSLASLPGVQRAALSSDLPYGGSGSTSTITVDGAVYGPEETPWAQRSTISPGLLETIRVPMVEGREFSRSDSPDSLRVAIVNEALVRRHFGGKSPIGRRIRTGTQPWMTIVGVSKDVRHSEIHRVVRPAIFLPSTQVPDRYLHLAVRTSGDPMRLAGAVRSAVLAIDRDQPIYDVMTLGKMVQNTLAGFNYVATSLTVYGLLALVLATVGVYSVMSNAVYERTHEIGVRIAMGAAESEVLRLVMRRGMTLTALGLAIGTACSYALARSIAGLIFGVSETDPASYLAVVAVLLATALAACYIPARRAMRLDPIVALRHD